MRGFAAIGLDRPKDSNNIGAVLRAAHCFRAASVIVRGPRYQRSATDTTKAWRHLPLLTVDDLMAACPFAAVPVAVELSDGAIPLEKFHHPESAFYIFGPEDGSISADILRRCKHVVQIDTAYCLNLAATVNVVLYDRAMKGSVE